MRRSVSQLPRPAAAPIGSAGLAVVGARTTSNRSKIFPIRERIGRSNARAAASAGPERSRPTFALWRVRGSSAPGSAMRSTHSRMPLIERGMKLAPTMPYAGSASSTWWPSPSSTAPIRSVADADLGVELRRRAAERDGRWRARSAGGRRLPRRVKVGPRRGLRPVAVAVAVAGRDVEHEGRVGDRACQRAQAGQPSERLGVGPGRDAPTLGLDADEVAPGRWNAHRARSVGADRPRHQPGRHGCRGAAARAAGRVIQIPWVAGDPEAGSLAERPLADLGRGRLADDHGARPTEPAHDFRVFGDRLEGAGAAEPGLLARDVRVVLDRDGTPRSGARSPAAIRRSHSSASCLAASPRTQRNAFRVPCVSSIRSRHAETSSAELVSPSASARACASRPAVWPTAVPDMSGRLGLTDGEVVRGRPPPS